MMMRVEKLSKSFDGFMAVKEANLSLRQGEIVAVIGPNGAGKTTLFNLITGQLKPDTGKVYLNDRDITGLPPYTICRRGVSRSFQIVNIFNRMTVYENVQAAVLSHQGKTGNIFSPSRNIARAETEKILLDLNLLDKADRVSGLLSYGDQKVLEVAVALANRPQLLILDEPTAGLAQEETQVIIDLIKQLSGDMGLNILFCEHDMAMVFSLAHTIMVMHQGRSIIQAPPDEVKNNPVVREAYLGGEE